MNRITQNLSTTAIGHLLALMTVIIWGTTFISTKVLLADFKPIEILFFRFILGYIALWLIYPKHLSWKGTKQEMMFALAGLCGVTLYFLCENIALTYTSASNVGIITTLAPIFTGLLAFIFLKSEKPRPLFFVGCFFALLGIAIISFNGQIVFSLNPLGDILAILACLCWAFYSIIIKKISFYGYHSIQITRRCFFYGLLFMLPILSLFGFQLHLERFYDPINLSNILFLGLGASALCFVTWNLAVKLIGAVKISLYIYLIPIIVIFTAVLILNEPFTTVIVLGTALTLCGLFISERKGG